MDAQLVDLLNRRAEVVVEVGQRKRATGNTQIYSSDREHQVLAHIAELNKGPLKKETLAAVPKHRDSSVVRQSNDSRISRER